MAGKKKLKPGLLGSFLLIFSLILNAFLGFKIINQDKGVKVVEVIDGDTFILEGNVSVRITSIEAPALEYCLGPEAKTRLEELVLGKRVMLKETTHDQFQRILALVYQGDKFINQILLEEGWGRYKSSNRHSQADNLIEAGQQARDKKQGVYGKCTLTDPPQENCLIKGNIDKRLGKKIYHFPGCSGYNAIIEADRGEQWFCSEKEAEESGFVKSENCYGKKYQVEK